MLAESYDTVQEAVSHTPTTEFCDLLESAKRAAVERQDDLEGFVLLELAGERLKCHATGAKGGFRWRIENDDYIVMIGSPKREWTISIRYLSAGLWEHGLDALRERAFKVLAPYTTQHSLDCVRVTRFDWCFDFYSPDFSKEFRPGLCENVVAHSSVKTCERGSYECWNRGKHGETLTIGAKSGLQVQLYDKTREIDDKSGKTWLYPIWIERMGKNPWGEKRPRDVWRLECRFAADFLKERNLRRPFEIRDRLPELVAEATYKRRLTIPNGDGNFWRWPMHPLWSEAYRQRGASALLPVGRKVTGRRSALKQAMIKSVAGAIRSGTVLDVGTYDEETAREVVQEALKQIGSDPKHETKVDRAMDRYSDVEAAR